MANKLHHLLCMQPIAFILRWMSEYLNWFLKYTYGPRQANLVLIAYASSEGSGESAHSRSLARTFAAHSYKQWIKRNLQTESQIPGPSEWLGMRSWSLSWRNAQRHKFAWLGSYTKWHLALCLLSLESWFFFFDVANSVYLDWNGQCFPCYAMKLAVDKISLQIKSTVIILSFRTDRSG